jgi:hypothetical protein
MGHPVILGIFLFKNLNSLIVQGGFIVKTPEMHTVYFQRVYNLYYIPLALIVLLLFLKQYFVGFIMLYLNIHIHNIF